jgi:TetR/AcrR family transcriptional regulator, tetracycline repressor protein
MPARPTAAAERRGPGHRAGLSADVILDEARRLAREEGVTRLTMRGLSRRLGVAPNTLYSHFPGKPALLDALLDGLLAPIETSDLDALDWREGLTELMRRSRTLLLGQADLLPHFLARPARGPNAIRLGEATLGLLARAGLEGEEAVEALRILLVFTFGDVALQAPRRADEDPVGRHEASAAAFAAAPQWPRMSALAERVAAPATDATFELGLAWLVEGIATTAARARHAGARRPRRASTLRAGRAPSVPDGHPPRRARGRSPGVG